MPGGVMTEKADFWAQFGPARTVSLDDASSSRMMMETGAEAPNPMGGGSGDAGEDAQPSEESEPAAESVTFTSDDGGTTITFNPDGTYVFALPSMNVEDVGTYTYEGGVLTVTNSAGTEVTAEGDTLVFHYVSAMSDQLVGDFTIAAADMAG